MAEIQLPYHWTPRPYQRASWDFLSDGGKRCVKNWHRRSGKDEEDLHHTSCAMHERIGNYWYMLPEYAQCRKAMWDAINPHTGRKRMEEAFPLALRKRIGGTNDQEMKITAANGSTFQLLGSDNFQSLVGSPPIGLVFSEYARTNPNAWAYLMPIVEENDGWVSFNSTPYGDNHFKTLCDFAQSEPGWFYECLTADQTGVYSQSQLQAILRQLQSQYGEDYGRSLWLQEYYASFDAAVPGSIWGDCLDRAQLDGRILEFPVNTLAKVNTAFDLGRTDDTSIWFYQLLAKQIDVFDHHASHFKDIDFYVKLLLQKRDEHAITYGTHYLPHDARPRTLAAGGKSILQQFHDAAKAHPELGRFVIGPRLDKQEGIQAARATFPYCRFHASRCRTGLSSLRHWHREWDDDKRKFVDAPVHDWASHDSDAFIELSKSWKFQIPAKPDSPLMDRVMAQNPVGQTWGSLRKKHLESRRSEREWANL